MGRARAKPGNVCSSADYAALLQSWMEAGPCQTLEFKVGKMVGDLRAVNPSSMSRLASLMKSIIEFGHGSGVLYGKRLEVGIADYLTQYPDRSGAGNIELMSNRLANHIMYHFGMLRCLKSENDAAGSWSRRYPRSGGFRRLADAETWAWLNPLM